MQSTVDVLLSMVKQENAQISQQQKSYAITPAEIVFEHYQNKTKTGIEWQLKMEELTTLDFPLPVLNMILKNLIENALRFTNNGVIRVEITSTRITVQDTGSGLDESVESEHGLGLLIVKRLCHAYSWNFTISNSAAGGCIAQLKAQS